MDQEHRHIIEKLDKLLEITHKIEKKDTQQDSEIHHLSEDVSECVGRLTPLEKRSNQLVGALQLLTMLGIGSAAGIIIKVFFI